MKNKLFRWLSAGSMVGLVLQLILPVNFALAQATSIGNLRTWENTVTSSSATLGFSFTSAGYFRIDYGTTPDTYTSFSSVETLTNTSYPYYYINVSGLSPSTTYYYRLASKTLNGTEWGYSSSSSFTTTAADTSPPNITSISATLINMDSATINFTPSEAGFAKIEYGTSGSFGNSSSEISVTAAGSSTNIWIQGLTAGTTYSYRIIARDSANNSGSSDTYTFTTLPPPDTTPPGITSVSASGVTANSATINFTLSEVASVKVEYGPSGTFTLSTAEASFPITPMSIALSGLTANTNYSYRLVARDAAGNSAPSASYTFTTTGGTTTSGAPTVSGAHTMTTTAPTAQIMWSCDQQCYGQVEYSTAPTYGGGLFTAWTTALSSSPAVDLPGLIANTTYYTRIYAKNTSGAVSSPISYNFTTSSGATTDTTAPTISAVAASGVTASSASITFTFNKTGYGKVEYGIGGNYGSVSSEIAASPNIPTSIYLSGLSSAATYNYRVVARDSANISTTSGSYSFTTTSSGTASGSSLIGHWKFDGNGNNDVAGGPGAVSVGGASFYASGGKLGGYAYIPSNSDYIRIPYSSSFDLPNAFTVEFWFRQRADRSFLQDLVYKGTPTNNYNFRIFRQLWNQYNYGPIITGYTAANTGYWSQTSNPNQLAHNVWHHVAYTKDASGSAYYLDGVLTHRLDTTQYTEYSGPAKTPASDIIIGDSAVDTDIDNLKIYNYALSAGEVQNSGPFSSTSADTTAPTVSGVWSSGVTSNSANVYFTLNEAGYAKVEYGPNNTFNLQTAELNVSANVSSTVYLSGLSSGITYSYRVAARDSANNNATSGSYVFTTTSGTTTATSTPATGTAGIKVIVKDPSGGFVSGSNVSVSNSSTGGSSWSTGYTGADGSFTATNLASGSYNIGVSSPSNRTDLGYISSYPVSLVSGTTITQELTLPRSTTTTATTTPPTTGAPTINNLRAQNVTVNSAEITWTSDQPVYGMLTYYDYDPANLENWSTNWTTTLSSNPVITISGLRAGITYEVRAYSKNASSISGTYNPTVVFTTTGGTVQQDTTAPVISGVHIMDNTSYRTQVMWGTDDQSYGQVEYGETTAYGKSTSWSATYSYSPTIDITGLSVGKLYHYRVRAKNQVGMETTSGDYTFTAGSSTTPTPTIFTVEPARSYPQSGASEVPLSNLKIHIEFSKSVDPNTVSGADLFFGFLGSTDGTSLSGSLDVFSNGFNFIPSQPLKSNTSYNFIVRSTIWAQTGEQLAGDYSITFTTAKEGTVAGQGTIKGTVKDGSGQPVANAYVSLRAGGAYATYTSSYYGGGSSSGFGYNQTTQTTTYGEYNFTNLAPGTYTIEAYPPSGGGGVDRPAPQAVTIAANETVTRDFAFASSGRFIKGTVKFSDGSPVTDAEVSAYKREGGGWVSSPTNESGAYTLAVGSGSWMVSIRPRYAPVPYATAYPSGSNFYSPPPPPPTPNWVYTNPPQEVYIDTESKVVDFMVPRQSANTSVSGTLERADGEPLSDGVATVRFIGQGGFSVSTAVPAGGRFSTPINPGGYKVYVDLTDSNLSSPDFPPISVSPGEQKDIGAIRLYSASASISGRVTTPDGKGIPRVKVGGWKMNSSDNSSASTDEKGEYVLKVSSGEWTVGIMPTPDQPYTTTAPPQVVRVKGGRVSGINFVLAQSDGIVNGVVTDENGNILSDFYGFVRVGSKGGSRVPGGAPVERGQFTLRLPAGSYILYMELPPNAGYGWPAPVPITVSTGESVKVAMKMATSAPSAVIGYLVDQAGNKITNAPFKVFASGEGGGWYSAITDEAIGYYKLKLPAGTWFIGYELAGEENSYERLGNRKKKVKVGAGEIVSLDLEVVRSSGKISGVIRDDDGKGVANVWIAIASSQFGTFSRVSAGSWRYLNGVNSDEKGNFTLNVPPGIYFVRAFVPPSMNFINPEEQKVRVAAGKEEAVELVLRGRETTITGKTTIAGIPNWAFVWAWSDTGGYTESAADDSGNYKLKVSSGDTWHVAAMAEIKRETFKASEVELVITRPGNYPLSLDLSPLGVKLPEPVTVSTEADQMTVAENSAGSKLVVPANAAGTEGALNVSITPQVLTPSQGADRVIGFGYEMEVRTPSGQEINTFNSELTVSIPYDPVELGRLNLSPTDLTLRFWDDTSSTWQMIENAVVDETNHVVTGSVAHLTRFALVAATDTEPPAAPAKVKAKVAGDGVVITWQKPKDKDLKYVKVYRSAKAGVLGEVAANNLTAATYKDSGMARGTTYYYLVRAVDAAGNESINKAAVKAAVSGKGTLGKKIAKGITAAKEKQKIKGTITDINLAASTVEIKNKAGKRITISFSPTLQVVKDRKKVLASTLKVGNTITAEVAKEGTTLTLLSAKAGSVKVKIKGKVKGAATVGGRGKVTVKVNDVQGQVQGASIKRGQEANINIKGGYLIKNGRAVPVEHLLSQGDVIVEGVLEDGGITVTKITPVR